MAEMTKSGAKKLIIN